MALRKTVMVDVEKVNRIVKSNNLTPKTFSESLGHTSSYLKHVRDTARMTVSDQLLIKSMYGVDVKLEEKQPVPVKVKEEEPKIDTDAILLAIEDSTKQIVGRIDTLIATINREGNVQMQILEELHKTNSHILKSNTSPYSKSNPYTKR